MWKLVSTPPPPGTSAYVAPTPSRSPPPSSSSGAGSSGAAAAGVPTTTAERPAPSMSAASVDALTQMEVRLMSTLRELAAKQEEHASTVRVLRSDVARLHAGRARCRAELLRAHPALCLGAASWARRWGALLSCRTTRGGALRRQEREGRQAGRRRRLWLSVTEKIQCDASFFAPKFFTTKKRGRVTFTYWKSSKRRVVTYHTM